MVLPDGNMNAMNVLRVHLKEGDMRYGTLTCPVVASLPTHRGQPERDNLKGKMSMTEEASS